MVRAGTVRKIRSVLYICLARIFFSDKGNHSFDVKNWEVTLTMLLYDIRKMYCGCGFINIR